MNGSTRIMLVVCLLLIGHACFSQGILPDLDVPYEPTHPKVVEAMLDLAKVKSGDRLFDLGCGDGRILIIGAKKYGVRGVGIDIDPQRLREANESAHIAGVEDQVQFILGDIFDFDFRDASVLTLYLLDDVLLRLRPIIFQQLRPGSRVVSHAFDMGAWQPDSVVIHPRARREEILLWNIPAPIGGEWNWTTEVSQKSVHWSLLITQTFQEALYTFGHPVPVTSDIKRVDLLGQHLSFKAQCTIDGKIAEVVYRGVAQGDAMVGIQEWRNGPSMGTFSWIAMRKPVDVKGSWKAKIQGGHDFQITLERAGSGVEYTDFISRKTRLTDVPVYIWGSSIWFEADDMTYKGFVSGDSIFGNVKGESFEGLLTWSAMRSRRAPTK